MKPRGCLGLQKGGPSSPQVSSPCGALTCLLYSEPLHSFLPGDNALPSRPFSDFRFICKTTAR